MIHRYLPSLILDAICGIHLITRQCAVHIRGAFGGLAEQCKERGGEGYVIGKECGVQPAV